MTVEEEVSQDLSRSSEGVISSKEEHSVLLNTPENNEEETCEKTSWRKICVLISLTYCNFWTAACVSLQAPFFPQEAESKGATPTQYGLVFGVFELAIIVISPVYGKLIPTVTPKFLITSGVFVEGAACVLFGVLDRVPAGNMYIGMAFAVRIVEGLGAAALVICSFTICASEFPKSVATTFSLLETGFGLGMIIGPTIGGALYQVGKFILPFSVCGGFLLLGFILLWILLPEQEEIVKQPRRELFRFLADWGTIMYTIAIVTTLLVEGFNAATLEPHLRKFNLTPFVLGLMFIITGGIYAITAPVFGRICDKGVTPYAITLLGYFLTAVGALFLGPAPFIPFTPTLGTVIVSLASIGLGLAAKVVSAFAGALKRTIERGFPDNLATYGMVSALFSISCSVGAFIGPSIGGLLLDTTGYEMGTVVVFAEEIFFMSALTAFLISKAGKKQSKKEDKAPLLNQKSQSCDETSPLLQQKSKTEYSNLNV